MTAAPQVAAVTQVAEAVHSDTGRMCRWRMCRWRMCRWWARQRAYAPYRESRPHRCPRCSLSDLALASFASSLNSCRSKRFVAPTVWRASASKQRTSRCKRSAHRMSSRCPSGTIYSRTRAPRAAAPRAQPNERPAFRSLSFARRSACIPPRRYKTFCTQSL